MSNRYLKWYFDPGQTPMFSLIREFKLQAIWQIVFRPRVNPWALPDEGFKDSRGG